MLSQSSEGIPSPTFILHEMLVPVLTSKVRLGRGDDRRVRVSHRLCHAAHVVVYEVNDVGAG